MIRTASAVAAGALALAAIVAAPVSADAASKVSYKNCKTYRATSHYRHGVGLASAECGEQHGGVGRKARPRCPCHRFGLGNRC